MTGYGKGEVTLDQGKMVVEIRSLNGKNADISLKSSFIPRDKELEVRQYIASVLQRGTIDLYITFEQNPAANAKSINIELFNEYLNQMKSVLSTTMIATGCGDKNLNDTAAVLLASNIVKMPDVIDSKRQELSEDDWNKLYDAIKSAVTALDEFRTKEGVSLRRDVLAKVDLIESYVLEVEKYEKERTDGVKDRILARMEELKLTPDVNRLEQEMIYYLEKLDINEEKVRLRQHCKYFRETLDNEQYPGKKIGFITQEMGREINTMGSKANHAEIQKWVVKMKDELEKIKEQSLNIL